MDGSRLALKIRFMITGGSRTFEDRRVIKI